jgi:hypothetical protein
VGVWVGGCVGGSVCVCVCVCDSTPTRKQIQHRHFTCIGWTYVYAIDDRRSIVEVRCGPTRATLRGRPATCKAAAVSGSTSLSFFNSVMASVAASYLCVCKRERVCVCEYARACVCVCVCVRLIGCSRVGVDK